MIKISNFEEKKWILAYFLKRQKRFGKWKMLKYWMGWWKEDFVPSSGYKNVKLYSGEVHNWNSRNDHSIHEEYTKLLNEIAVFVTNETRNYTLDEIKKQLYKVKRRSGNQVPISVKKKAKKLGYRVSRNIAGKRHPLRVCGFYIYKGDKIVYGKSHDLELSDVVEFLKIEKTKRENQKEESINTENLKEDN